MANVAVKKATKATAKNMKVVTKKGISNERKALFNAIMNNLRPLYTVNGDILTKVGDIPLDLLIVDDSYQGYRVHKKINSLVANWDYRKLDLITVVPHYDTYTFSVVDGQGRTIAARNLKLDSLCAKVLMDAPTDPKERLKYEADIFVRQDDQLEKLRAVEKHLAYGLIGDEAALAMNRVMKKYHINFVDGQGNRSSRILGSYSETFNIVKLYGEDALEYIFAIIENAGWGDATNGYSVGIVRALKFMYMVHEEERKNSYEYLSAKLRNMDPQVFKANATVKYPARDYRQAMALYMEDLLIDAGVVEKATYKESVFTKKVGKAND